MSGSDKVIGNVKCAKTLIVVITLAVVHQI